MSDIHIRPARSHDMGAVLGLIQELAAYEKAPGEVLMTEEQLRIDGFGKDVLFECIVAESDEQVVGMALYYPKYSTWKGRCLFLEDLVVSSQFRNQGVGELLLKRLVKIARDYGAKKLEWQVLDWNESAIKFYEKFATELDSEWINCKLDELQLSHFQEKK